jgi:hypothetical protein
VAKLRSNFGSHTEVHRVLSYDAEMQNVCVVWKDQWNNGHLSHQCVSLSALEAIEKDGNTFGDVEAEVLKRAGYILNREPTRAA